MQFETIPISVVIPTINRVDSLIFTIRSFLNSYFRPFEIIIIDQSTLNNQSFFLEFPIVKYFHVNYKSLTKARNQGLELCKSEIVLFADDDIEIFNNTLINLYKYMNNHTVSMIGAYNNLEKGSFFSLLNIFLLKKSFFKSFRGHVSISFYGNFPITITDCETEWAMGFFFSIKKSLVEKWKLSFDENLKTYAYSEDLDFTYRYYLKSKREKRYCYFKTDVKVNHHISKDNRISNQLLQNRVYCNRYYLLYKNGYNNLFLFGFYFSMFSDFLLSLLNFNKLIVNYKSIVYFFNNKSDIRNGILP